MTAAVLAVSGGIRLEAGTQEDAGAARVLAEERAKALPGANAGDADAQFRLGNVESLERSMGLGEGPDAALWYRRAAEQGHMGAQYALGRLYRDGEGVDVDYVLAVEWYGRAADQGSPRAQVSLGDLYKDGRGVSQDYARAAGWYRQAAERGDAVAQFDLADLYLSGNGVPRDYVQAHMWLHLAAVQWPVQENNLVALLREWVAARMTPDELAEAQRLARDWESR